MDRRNFLAALLAAPLCQVRSICAQTNDLTALTIAEASRQLAARSITPLQLTNAYLSRIAKLNPSLHAFITVTADLARREAKAVRQFSNPLAGIPIAHKDLIETRGVKTTAGSRLFADHVPADNADVVQRFEDAGAIMLGKTNLHELGAGATGINPISGTTRNPADQLRIAGGSSGGSAAAVAARLCAAATGTDTGGSIRIPAALCGCVGFKPTFGRVDAKGVLGVTPTFDHVGFLTRTVEDAQLIWRLFDRAPSVSLRAPIRVGVMREYFFDDLDSVVAATVAKTLDRIRSQGAALSDVQLPGAFKAMEATEFENVANFEQWGRLGPEWRTSSSLFPDTLAAVFKKGRPPVATYEAAMATLKAFQSQIDAVFDSVDVIAVPTVKVVAPPIASAGDGLILILNTWAFNAAHTPAISIPIHTSGLPVGLQLVARRGDDDKLLQIARSFIGPQ